MMRRYALRFGLPAEVMIVEALSSSTLENARQTQTICEERGCRSILLVTSPYQSRRARRVFRDVLGPQVRVVAQPALQGALKLHWWRYPDHVLVVVYEYQHRVRDWVQGAVSVVRDGADRGAGQRDPCHSGLTVLECLFDPR